jgi:adenylate cyclase
MPGERVVSEAPAEPRAAPGRLPRWWQARRQRLLRLWGAGLLASLAVTAASALGYLEGLQASALDLILVLGGQRFPRDVVIVAVDDAVFDALEQRQPIPRQHLARVVRGLHKSGAAAVGLDISLRTATAEDDALADAIREFSEGGLSRVVLLEGRPPDSGPFAAPAFRAAVLRGSDRMPIDRDGVIRRAALAVPDGDSAVPALATAVLARVADATPALRLAVERAAGGPVALPFWQSDDTWQSPGPEIDVRPGQLWRLGFVGAEKSFLTIPSSAVAALADPGVTVPADNAIRGRVALVGATFRDSRDFFQTPVGRLPGVEVHANLLHMLATRRLIRPSGWLASFGIQLAVIAAAGVFLVLFRPLAGTLLAILVAIAIGLPASYLALYGGGFTVDYLLPVLATCVLGFVAQRQARRRLRESFGRYVGRDVLSQIVAESPTLGGERREVSILVSDIRGFTTLSEKLPAETVAAHLNAYFPAMVGAIFAHRGTVDDFIGDGILAVFGAPIADPDHARQAVRAAVAMQQALQELNRDWETRGSPTLRMGIGVHTGVVFVGNVGSLERAKYTVIGDAVNATARLEGVNKELGTSILMTEETLHAVGDLADVRPRGDVVVKGREEPLRVYEVVGLRSAGPPPGGMS